MLRGWRWEHEQPVSMKIGGNREPGSVQRKRNPTSSTPAAHTWHLTHFIRTKKENSATSWHSRHNCEGWLVVTPGQETDLLPQETHLQSWAVSVSSSNSQQQKLMTVSQNVKLFLSNGAKLVGCFFCVFLQLNDRDKGCVGGFDTWGQFCSESKSQLLLA